jgi:hypothetical protein
MSRIMRLVVLATALLSSLGAFAATSGAVTWDTNGPATFDATGGPSTFSIDQDPPTAGGALLTCTLTTASLTVTPTTSGIVFTALSGTSTTSCSALGIPYTIHCGLAMTALTWTAGSPAVTSGTLDQSCDLYRAGVYGCTFPADSPVDYVNPVAATPGRLTLTGFSAPVPPCLTSAVGTFTLTEQSWRVTSGGGPVITRTA